VPRSSVSLVLESRVRVRARVSLLHLGRLLKTNLLALYIKY